MSTESSTRRSFLAAIPALAAAPLIARDYGPGAPPVRYPEPNVIVLGKAFEKHRIGSAPIERLHTGMYWAEPMRCFSKALPNTITFGSG